jgi:hypothetical protein
MTSPLRLYLYLMAMDPKQDEPAAAPASSTVYVEQWSDALIRAVADAAPEIFRTEYPFAVRPSDMRAYAHEIALVSFEEEDLAYVDLDGYAAAEREQLFRRIDVDGETWYVIDWQAERPGDSGWQVDLPQTARSANIEDWPDTLLAAVGRQAPQLLRTLQGDAWMVTAADFPRFADYWLFEGFCDAMLYPFVDRARFEQDLHAKFTAITSGDELWYVHAGDSSAATRAQAPVGEDVLNLLDWPDELVAAVAAALPDAFRSHDYEMIAAIADEQLATVLTDWAGGREAEVTKAGGLAAWKELTTQEDLRAVEVSGQRWWIYIPDWKRPAHS